MKSIFIFLLAIFSFDSLAEDFSCKKGELIRRTIHSAGAVNDFLFSKNCLLRNETEKHVLMKGNSYVNLEVYWPGLISYEDMITFKENISASSGGKNYIRSFVTLSYGPTPMMISSAIDSYASRRNYDLFKDNGDYYYYKKKSGQLKSKSEKSNETFYIAHKESKEFWVLCIKKQCYINGIVGNVKYELSMKTDISFDWVLIHQEMVYFIEKIQIN